MNADNPSTEYSIARIRAFGHLWSTDPRSSVLICGKKTLASAKPPNVGRNEIANAIARHDRPNYVDGRGRTRR
jgi:hypothetical protein